MGTESSPLEVKETENVVLSSDDTLRPLNPLSRSLESLEAEMQAHDIGVQHIWVLSCQELLPLAT